MTSIKQKDEVDKVQTEQNAHGLISDGLIDGTDLHDTQNAWVPYDVLFIHSRRVFVSFMNLDIRDAQY
jgi:hypothetical protein